MLLLENGAAVLTPNTGRLPFTGGGSTWFDELAGDVIPTSSIGGCKGGTGRRLMVFPLAFVFAVLLLDVAKIDTTHKVLVRPIL